ncbi:hypothetical protein [Candidatus Clostridium radicumherbarum]|uniref:Uncharacterized protein n=1 Tax=Candidatus Clostridium radicumherbarum TaxID=3381662 RepID=A0ABW8TQ12_9CLOT
MTTENQVKDFFCQTYEVSQNEVKVLNYTDKTLSVEIQNTVFNYTYTFENNVIRFKPVDKL